MELTPKKPMVKPTSSSSAENRSSKLKSVIGTISKKAPEPNSSSAVSRSTLKSVVHRPDHVNDQVEAAENRSGTPGRPSAHAGAENRTGEQTTTEAASRIKQQPMGSAENRSTTASADGAASRTSQPSKTSADAHVIKQPPGPANRDLTDSTSDEENLEFDEERGELRLMRTRRVLTPFEKGTNCDELDRSVQQMLLQEVDDELMPPESDQEGRGQHAVSREEEAVYWAAVDRDQKAKLADDRRRPPEAEMHCGRAAPAPAPNRKLDRHTAIKLDRHTSIKRNRRTECNRHLNDQRNSPNAHQDVDHDRRKRSPSSDSAGSTGNRSKRRSPSHSSGTETVSSDSEPGELRSRSSRPIHGNFDHSAFMFSQMLALQQEQRNREGFNNCTFRFDGNREYTETFIQQVESYKAATRLDDDAARASLFTLFMEPVSTWWRNLQKRTPTWNEAITGLRRAYGDHQAPEVVWQEVFRRQHGPNESAEEFLSQRLNLINRIVPRPREQNQVDMILGGLRQELRKHIKRRPDDITGLIQAVRRADEEHQRTQWQAKQRPFKPGNLNHLQVNQEDQAKPAGGEKPPRCNFCRVYVQANGGHSSKDCPRKEEIKQKRTDRKFAKSDLARRPTEYACKNCGKGVASGLRCSCIAGPREHQFNAMHFRRSSTPDAKPLRFNVTVAGLPGSALCDTGADRSVCSKSLYDSLIKQGRVAEESDAWIRFAAGEYRMMRVHTMNLPVEIEGRAETSVFHYFPETPSGNSLIGRDVMKSLDIVIDNRRDRFAFGDNLHKFYEFDTSDDSSANQVHADQPSVRELAFAPIRFVDEQGEVQVNHPILEEDEQVTYELPEVSFNLPDSATPADERVRKLIELFPTVFAVTGPPTDLAVHQIDTQQARPINAAGYRPSPKYREAIEAEIEKMLTAGVIEECESAWAAPIVAVPKKDGSLRICIDYRRLNKVTPADSYPMPAIENLLHSAKTAGCVSTIDLQAGYWQVPVAPKDRDKTAFVAPNGFYRFRVMPFGLRNAPATFQRMADRIRHLLPEVVVFAYLDDFIIISTDEATHEDDLKRVLALLSAHHLRVNRNKCRFFATHVKYLGHIITPNGISTDPDKTRALLERPAPANKEEAVSFVQTAAWYRRFIPAFSRIVEPLHLRTLHNAEWVWGHDEQAAFVHLRQLLANAPVLRQVDYQLPFRLFTDASAYALGAVLVQGRETSDERPLEFASRRLIGAEIRYTVTEKEALAVVWALEKFRGYITGSPITVVTDHQPLRWLFDQTLAAGRLARWALRLMGFDLTIEHLAGKYNVVADYLSRPYIGPTMKLNLVAIADSSVAKQITRADQMVDSEISKIILALEIGGGAESAAEHYRSRGFFVSSGRLYRFTDEDGDFCPIVVPALCRPKILADFHGSAAAGHFGIDRTYAKVAARFFWPSMRRDVRQFVLSCAQCQRYKPITRPPQQLYQARAPARRFETVAIDLVGPIATVEGGKRQVLVMQDTATRWTEMFPVGCGKNDATAEECADLLVSEIAYRFGTPRRLISDNGTQFASRLFKAMCSLLDVHFELIPTHHPEANPVERRNRDLRSQLSIMVGEDHTTWPQRIAAIRFCFNTTVCSATGYSPAYLLFGCELRHPADSARDLREVVRGGSFHLDVQPYLARLAQTLEEVYETSRERSIQPTADSGYRMGQLVLIRSHGQSNARNSRSAKLLPRRDGPYRIVRMISPTVAELEKLDRTPIGSHSVNDLTPWIQREGSPLPAPEVPIRGRGRPRKVTATD